jgi:hypothetical protein
VRAEPGCPSCVGFGQRLSGQGIGGCTPTATTPPARAHPAGRGLARAGYNRRLRRLGATLNWLIGALARDTSVWSDDVWVVDSTPVGCSRSRETVRRSDLAGWAEYGDCAGHSRFFRGLGLHLVATLHGLPVGYALTGAKADERQVLVDLLHDDPTLAASRPGQILLEDKNYFGREFEASIAERVIQLLRRARKGEPERPGGRFFKPLRQTVESILDTLKGQLDLEQHGGHTPQGVLVRVMQRILAMTTAIWHNDRTGRGSALLEEAIKLSQVAGDPSGS